ncbi:MAG: tetratricopeptide repeat protein [Candidatus Acidiferrales bacterium]
MNRRQNSTVIFLLTIAFFFASLAAHRILFPPPAQAADTNPAVEQARHFFDSGNYNAAINALNNAVAQNAGNAEAYYWLGRCYYELKDYKSAAAQAEKSTQLDPKNSNYHHWLGTIYGGEADRERSFSLARKVKKEYEEAVRLNPSNLDARRDLEEFDIQAPWIVGGSSDGAREQVDAIAAIDPIIGHLARAEFDNSSLKKPDLAQNEFRLVLEAHPAQIDPYIEIADVDRQLNRPDDMAIALAAAEKVKPGDPRIEYFRAVQYILQKTQLSTAEPLLKAYLASTPDRSGWPSHASARLWLGRLYEQEGKRQIAAEQYRAALQLDPENKEAKEKLQKLEKGS